MLSYTGIKGYSFALGIIMEAGVEKNGLKIDNTPKESGIFWGIKKHVYFSFFRSFSDKIGVPSDFLDTSSASKGDSSMTASS